jgi:hypothetical protein
MCLILKLMLILLLLLITITIGVSQALPTCSATVLRGTGPAALRCSPSGVRSITTGSAVWVPAVTMGAGGMQAVWVRGCAENCTCATPSVACCDLHPLMWVTVNKH